MELKTQHKPIKTAFCKATGLHFGVTIKDVASLDGPFSFIQEVKPNLSSLIINLPNGTGAAHFSKFGKSIGDLPTKVNKNLFVNKN